MSAINTQLNNNYYQLNSSHSGGSSTTGRAQGAVPSLASALSGNNTISSGFSDAVLLDLSPAAQQYLQGLGAKVATPQAASSTASNQDGFLLSDKQQQALNTILDKYKDAPYTQDTFDALQNDLHGAGLGPEQLSAQYRVNNFSSTAVLVDALNGGKGTTPGSTPVSDEVLRGKSNSYMQSVISQWKQISNDYQKQQEDASTGASSVKPVGSADSAS